jgi:hypothetical protein
MDEILEEYDDDNIKWLSEIQYQDNQGDNCLYFGNWFVGIWRCECRKLFPRQLEELFDNKEIETDKGCNHFICLKCNSVFEYDEEA